MPRYVTKPNIYVSYSGGFRKDDILVLADKLRQYFNVWLASGRCPGDDIAKPEVQAIADSDVILVCFSHDYRTCKSREKEQETVASCAKPMHAILLDPSVELDETCETLFSQENYDTLGDVKDAEYLRQFVSDLTDKLDEIVDRYRMRLLNAPSFPYRLAQPQVESIVLEVYMQCIFDNPKAGLFLLTGPAKIGKTHLLAEFLQRRENQRHFIGPVTRIGIWQNCQKWLPSQTFDAKAKAAFNELLIDKARKLLPLVDNLSDLSPYATLLVLDDVRHVSLLEHIYDTAKNLQLPCCVICNHAALEAMRLDPDFRRCIKPNLHLDISRANDKVMQKVVKSHLKLNNINTDGVDADQMKQLVAACNGLPGMAAELCGLLRKRLRRSKTKKRDARLQLDKIIVQRRVSSCSTQRSSLALVNTASTAYDLYRKVERETSFFSDFGVM